jgi:hypothetical protein
MAIGLLSCGSHQPASADTSQAIGAKVTSFYKWYVGQIKADKSPMKNRAMIRRHVSARLWRWLNSSAYGEYGADYFIAAQDFDSDWDQAKVSDVRINGNVARLKVTLGQPKARDKGIGTHSLDLRLVKQSGAWKIDRVSS